MNRWSTEDIQGNKNTLYDTIMMDTCTFVYIPRMYREWTVNYGLWVVRMSHKFINGNKCTILVREVDNRGGYACVRGGEI